jgi:hypothetical protein
MSQKVIDYLTRKGLKAPAAAAATAAAVPSVAVASGSASILTSSSKTKSAFTSGVMAFFFYMSSFLFIILLILTFINFTIYPIFNMVQPDKPTSKPDMQSGWLKAPPLVSEPAGVTSLTGVTTTVNPSDIYYTVSFEIYIKSDYSSGTVPRIILYEAFTPLILPSSTTISVSNLKTLFSNSNLIVYLSSNTNDLNVVGITSSNSGITKSVEIIATIKNIKLGKPFRLTVAYLTNYAEVYIDGKLNSTYIFVNKPITPMNTPLQKNYFYPPLDTSIKVGTLYYWPHELSITQLQTLIPLSSSTFFT